IQGKWKITAITIDGKTTTPEGSEDNLLQFEGDKMISIKKGTPKEAGRFTLDPTAKPKQLDITFFVERTITEKDQEPKTEQIHQLGKCIYELNGDTLKFAKFITGQSERRPATLDSAADDGIAVMTLKRVK